jgi:hypothetical protein
VTSYCNFFFRKVRLKVKAKVTVNAMKAQNGVELKLCPFFYFGSREGGWSPSSPHRFTSGKEPLYPWYRRLDAPGV